MSERLVASGSAARLWPPDESSAPSAWRAWCALVGLSWQRQARARQIVWIALGLLAFATVLVAINTAAERWTMERWRYVPRGFPRYLRMHYPTWVTAAQAASFGTPEAAGLHQALLGPVHAVIQESGFYVFSTRAIFPIFVSFLLPIWSLSFATEAFGSEREGSSLVWLLSRPLPRPAVYLAKFVGLLPWSLGLNLGGFAILCLAAGPPGRMALALYWPAVLWGSLAFCSLFYLMGAWFRRAAVIGMVYSFFLEAILGNMPGYLKRISLGFYTRCMMFDAAHDYGVVPEKPTVYLPVDGWTAWAVLAGVTVGLLVVGMIVFSRQEYRDVT